MDFDDPPEPPEGLDGDYLALSGQFIAPRPFSERARQRAVNDLSVFKGYRTTAGDRKPKGRETFPTIPKNDNPLPPLPDKSSDRIDSTSVTNATDALEALSLEAKERFGTAISRVSIMDGDSQRFVAGGQDVGKALDRDGQFVRLHSSLSACTILVRSALT